MVDYEGQLLQLHREIGAKACAFAGSVQPADLQTLLLEHSDKGKIVEEAILRSIGLISLPQWDECIKVQEGILISEFLNTHLSRQDFRNGMLFMAQWIRKLRPFIEGTTDYSKQPENNIAIPYTGYYFTRQPSVSYRSMDLHLSCEPRGMSLVQGLGNDFQRGYYAYLLGAEYADGIQLSVNLFVTAGLEYTEQRILELSQLQHARAFLRQTGALINRF